MNPDGESAVSNNNKKGKTRDAKKLSLKEKLSLDNLMSDNAMISIYPLGNKYFCFYESPFLCQIDPRSLDTLDRVDLNKKLSIFSHGSHPHYDNEGNMFTIGMKIGLTGPEYIISKFPQDSAEAFGNGRLVAKVRSRWMLEPGYMHSFAVTDNYFILIEQPLTVHAPTLAKGTLTFCSCVCGIEETKNQLLPLL